MSRDARTGKILWLPLMMLLLWLSAPQRAWAHHRASAEEVRTWLIVAGIVVVVAVLLVLGLIVLTVMLGVGGVAAILGFVAKKKREAANAPAAKGKGGASALWLEDEDDG